MSMLYVVHCVDTEGPLSETIEATFERLRKEKKIDFSPSLALLTALQNQEIDLGGEEQAIADYLAPARLAYLSDWQQVAAMISQATNYHYRLKHSSPDGSIYTYSWFVIDIVGYQDNPRNKAIGFHTVWDHYHHLLKDSFYQDVIGWHFHTVAPTYHALHYNTAWTNNDFHEQVLARKIIEKKWFPALFRAGGVIQRNDLSHWLERFIPFDFSNQNNKYANYRPGEQSDWRHASLRWGSYQPDFYDYRKAGKMKRHIFRCLDVHTPDCRLDLEEVELSFKEALENKVAVLAYTNHDRRDLKPDVENVHNMICQVAKKYPDVQWQYVNALTAARKYLNRKVDLKLEITLTFEAEVLTIKANQPLFTGDIFVAIENNQGQFYRDNASMESETTWAYRSSYWDAIRKIGIAAVSADGQTTCEVMAIKEKK